MPESFGQPIDVLLAQLLDELAYFRFFAPGITLMVGGMMVSGIPANYSDYYSWVADRMTESYEDAAQNMPFPGAETDPNETEEHFRQYLRDQGERWKKQMTDVANTADENVKKRLWNAAPLDDESQDYRRSPRGYVYLREATVVLPDGETHEFDFWRVRMDAVSGWTFGELV